MTRIEVDHHYRQYLGKARDVLEMDMGEGTLLIYECADAPCKDATTAATAGLSERLSPPPVGNELLFACHDRYYGPDVSRLVASVAKLLAEDAERSGGRLTAGKALGPAGPLLDCTKMDVLYVYPPVFHHEKLSKLEVPEGEIRIWWLLPLYESESRWAERHGYAEFVRRLETLDPDVLDLARPPMRL